MDMHKHAQLYIIIHYIFTSQNNKTIYSLYVRDYEDKKILWKNEGDYPTFLKATNWFSKAQSLTEPRIFEALKLAGLDK